MRAVVTGGTGFVGTHLIDLLIENGVDVVSISRGNRKDRFSSTGKVTSVKADIGNLTEMEEVIREGDTVFHTAAVLGSARASREEYTRVNVDGALNVLNAAINKKAASFIFISSLAAMGPVGSPDDPMTEDTPCMPDSLYGESKLAAEKAVIKAVGSRIACVILRPPIIYGPGASPSSGAGKLFAGMMKKTMLMIGSTRNYFAICYVKNLVSAMYFFALKHKKGIHTYIIADQPISVFNDILMIIRDAFGINRHLLRIPAAPIYLIASLLKLAGRIFRFAPVLSKDVIEGMAESTYYYSMAAAEKNGFLPPFSIEAGILQTAESFKSN